MTDAHEKRNDLRRYDRKHQPQQKQASGDELSGGEPLQKFETILSRLNLRCHNVPDLIGIMSATAAAVIFPLTVIIWFSAQLFQTFLSYTSLSNPVYDSSSHITPWRCLFAVALPVLIAQRAYRRQQLSWNGALSAVVIGCIMTLASYSFMVAMLAFFFVSMRATRLHIASSRRRNPSHPIKQHTRTWLNVICNGAVPANCALLMMLEFGCGERWIDFKREHRGSSYALALVGALACSCGDTLASDLGSIWGGVPWMLVHPTRRVPPGTNGAVSFAGLILSAAGGIVVGFAFYVTNLLMLSSDIFSTKTVGGAVPQWPVIVVAGVAGFIGSMIDSVLGSTLQYSGIAAPKASVTSYNSPGRADHTKKPRRTANYDFDDADVTVTDSPLQSIKRICGTPVLDNHSINLISSFITALITPKLAAWLWPLLARFDAGSWYRSYVMPYI